LEQRDVSLADSARQLLAQARSEADRLRHAYIGTEHLLLALASDTTSGAATTLLALLINTNQIRETVYGIVQRGNSRSSDETVLPYTSRTQTVFALAKETAHELGEDAVAAEHFLVGLLRERNGIGGQVLMQQGLSESACIAELKRLKSIQ
jgi:ATP-dependent Clp protease ATP-binding subunit ClpC